MPLWKAFFIIPYETADAFSDALEAAVRPEALAVSMSEAEPGTSPLVKTASDWNEVEAHGLWRVEALYEDEPDETVLRERLAQTERETGTTVAGLHIEPMPEVDWVTRSLEGLDPVRAGRFFIHGSHDAARIPAGAIPIRIDAAQAFGTGHHETTAGCLEFISECVRPGVKINALDIGTGTGVLAIAIAKLARVNVLASDIDPVSVAIAKANARVNGIGPFVSAVPARGFGHPALRARAPYDLIVANILARPLVALAPAFATHLKPGGALILSGLLATQEPMVASAMRMQGLKLVARKPIDDWMTLRLAG